MRVKEQQTYRRWEWKRGLNWLSLLLIVALMSMPLGRAQDEADTAIPPELAETISISLPDDEKPRGVPEGIAVGQRAPDFTLTDLDGTPITLSRLRGQWVILNFWASYCPACRREMPALETIARDFGDVIVLGINSGEPETTIRAFLSDVGATYPTLLDKQAEVTVAYRALRLPTTVFIDEQGVIVFKALKAMSEERLREQLEKLQPDTKGIGSLEQLEAAQVILRPASVRDHVLQGTGAEGLSWAVEDDRHRPPIGMAIGLVAPLLAHEDKSIVEQGAHELPRRDIARQDHTLTATVGADLTSTSPAGSVGMSSPAWRRAST